MLPAVWSILSLPWRRLNLLRLSAILSNLVLQLGDSPSEFPSLKPWKISPITFPAFSIIPAWAAFSFFLMEPSLLQLLHRAGRRDLDG
ncbi:uncharacterized protein ASPGLDRAFT_646740 [Aspergillus glaucus CBS 516.65]|uniref:Uncharacterized protein n=1 Tax=Aspergillus glaucus CBS 516.65 TaxID=1160497 RepID=A0A1L9VCR3_ASPGL|nr:hypothetical protein ASPGLDRAFT_646740 [Aspergillus glaucus CBS 516.65]OJJ81700.1 hypothetical protein ASPGLDRAFT_646740 [Aspergillus glaucus CBS 516.65]